MGCLTRIASENHQRAASEASPVPSISELEQYPRSTSTARLFKSRNIRNRDHRGTAEITSRPSLPQQHGSTCDNMERSVSSCSKLYRSKVTD